MGNQTRERGKVIRQVRKTNWGRKAGMSKDVGCKQILFVEI